MANIPVPIRNAIVAINGKNAVLNDWGIAGESKIVSTIIPQAAMRYMRLKRGQCLSVNRGTSQSGLIHNMLKFAPVNGCSEKIIK